MKNLYRRLGLGSSATTGQIRKAIAACGDEETRLDATAVLLDDSRRQAYDRAYRTIHAVREVRRRLGLLAAPNWSPQLRQEFALTSASTPPTRPPSAGSVANTAQTVIGCLMLFAASIIVMLLIASGLRDRRPDATGPIHRGAALSQQATDVAPRVDEATMFADRRLGPLGASTEEIQAAASRIRSGASSPRPRSGIMERSRSGSVPVRVETSLGSDYYIKFVRGDSTISTGYIRGGESLTFNVPAGGYDVRYAAGQRWFGPELHYGPDTEYSRCDRLMQFDADYEYTIELILQYDGNLPTSRMSGDAF